MYRYIKAIAALAGGAFPLALVGLLALFGLHLDPNLVLKFAFLASVFLAPVATIFAPKNAEQTATEDLAAQTLANEVTDVVSKAADYRSVEKPAS